jgi:hypothetical protein
MIRELGYKRRDFDVSSVASFVSFSSEVSAIDNNLHGIGAVVTSKMVSMRRQLTKASLKSSYISGDLRNALMDDDTAMQLALLKLITRRLKMIKYKMETSSTSPARQRRGDDGADDEEKKKNQNQNDHDGDDKNSNNNNNFDDIKLLTKILLPLLNCSPDVLVSTAACCVFAEFLQVVVAPTIMMNKNTNNDDVSASSSSFVISIQETLRSISLRAQGSLELDSVSQALASFSKTMVALLSVTATTATASQNSNNTSSNKSSFSSSFLLGNNIYTRLISQTAQSSSSSSSSSILSYALRIRRLGFILSAKVFELLLSRASSSASGDEHQNSDDEKDLQLTEFLEWMSQCGLCVVVVDDNDNNGADSNKTTTATILSVSIDALHCGLRLVKDEILEAITNSDNDDDEVDNENDGTMMVMNNNNNELYDKVLSFEDFRQLCCDFELRL